MRTALSSMAHINFLAKKKKKRIANEKGNMFKDYVQDFGEWIVGK